MISACLSFSIETACLIYTPAKAGLVSAGSHIMSNEMPDDPTNEMLEIQKHIQQFVDKMRAMMITDLPPEQQREARGWVRRMFKRYTERARRVIPIARYEATQFGSTTIETEHVLLALLREDKDL